MRTLSTRHLTIAAVCFDRAFAFAVALPLLCPCFSCLSSSPKGSALPCLRFYLLLIPINPHLYRPTLSNPRPIHPWRIKAPGHLPIWSDRNHATIPVNRPQLLLHHLIYRSLQFHSLVLHQRADRPRHRQPDKVLPRPRSRHRTRLIRRISPRANNRRITHPIPLLSL